MATFYSSGTIALTNGSTAVIGTGTAFVANVMVGWSLQLLSAGGDLTDYEVAAVVSNTQLTLARAYQGSTGGGRAYQVKPTRGTEIALVQALQALIDDYQEVLDGAGEGIFAGGSLATPGVRSAADTDTGLWWNGTALIAVVGGAERLRATVNGAQITGLLSGTAVTQAADDGTAGRLHKNGDFGIGGIGPTIGDCGVTDNSIAPGLYNYVTGTSSGGPAGVTHGQLIHRRRAPGGGETQLMVVEAGTSGLIAGMVLARARSSAGWFPWTHAGIRDSDSNANGRYVRFADGTALAWNNALTSSASGEVTWTYPIGFASGHLVQLTPNSSTLAQLSGRITARSVSSVDFSVTNASAARVACAVDLLAIGKWI